MKYILQSWFGPLNTLNVFFFKRRTCFPDIKKTTNRSPGSAAIKNRTSSPVRKNVKPQNMDTYEPPRDKTNKMTSAHSQDADQSGHPLSLISLRCPLEEAMDT